jgi:hypothetical protein
MLRRESNLHDTQFHTDLLLPDQTFLNLDVEMISYLASEQCGENAYRLLDYKA